VITILSSAPQALLLGIRTAVNDRVVRTWIYDSDGDFTHVAPQWTRLAWFRPRAGVDRLVLNIFPPQDTPITKMVYAYYHGHFVEMLLSHFDDRFSIAQATALPGHGDMVVG
jgi:hypothetical protein